MLAPCGGLVVPRVGGTIMLAGNIPGQTSTLSLAIFQSVQLGQDAHVYTLLGISISLAFLAVWTSELVIRRQRQPR
jgi:molybdate transport system permease protein